MKKFPSIEQFRNVIHTVKSRHDYHGKDENGEAIINHTEPYPTLRFCGTVKLHGTNAAVVNYKDRIEFQSRENVLTIQKDNAGFALAMSNKNLDLLFEGIPFNEYIAIYGEWCGGNIQKGVALNQLPKMFVIFGIKVDDVWVDFHKYSKEQINYSLLKSNEQLIYHINQFKTYYIDIDFENPQLAQNQLVEWTLEVENECPVGKQLGVSGIGEGIVFSCIDQPGLTFKSKGEKHSVSKVTKLNAVDTVMLAGIINFVDLAVTENRLMQGIAYLNEMKMELTTKSTPDFLRWVVNDIIKEESDTIIKNQFDMKKIRSAISNKARVWFFNYLNTNL